MVDNFSQAVNELEKVDNIVLFAALKMDDYTDRWTLIFAVNNINDAQGFFDSMTKIIKDNITPELDQNIARVGVFSTEDHLIQALINYPVGGEIREIKANGNFIHEGHIFISKRGTNQTELVP